MATVEVTFTPLPAHVRTARLVATAVARRSGVDESLLDEVRLAVGEACSRAVESHQRHCPGEPVRVALSDSGELFEVEVTDSAPAGTNGVGLADGPGSGSVPGSGSAAGSGSGLAAGSGSAAGAGSGSGSAAGAGGSAPRGQNGRPASDLQLPAGVGLAVISGLADDVRISATESGLSVRMSWHHAAPEPA